MTERKKYSGTTTSVTASTGVKCEVDISTAKTQTTRLRRSLRQTQRQPPPDSPNYCHNVFKTPTRVSRSRYTYAESPQNESELQQDIIWDATSPSPIRADRKGKKYSANVGIVNISDIVNRIAPKGRPVVPESSLQQWIGDSAISCTPEVEQPKLKRKSPRQNGVDDLIKLAKQFDFNMLRQDEEHVQIHNESVISDMFNFDGEKCQPSLLLSKRAPEKAPSALQTNVRESSVLLPPDQDMEDDLNFLFDGPSQRISGNFSQNSLARSLEMKTVPTAFSKVIPGKDTNSGPSVVPPVSTSPHVKHGSMHGDFDDDWENDDLLDESFVFEMTQNDLGSAPFKHSSLQRGSNESKTSIRPPSTIVNNECQRLQKEKSDLQPAVSEKPVNAVRNRTTFRLEANPHIQVNIFTEAPAKIESASELVKPGKYREVQQCKSSALSHANVISTVAGSHGKQTMELHSNGIKPGPQAPLFYQSTWTPTSTSTSTNSCPAKPSQTNSSQKPEEKEVNKEDSSAFSYDNCIPEDDLDSFFALDDVWDDKDGDDDLLCELCEDLESQVQSVEDPPIKYFQPTSQVQNQKPASVLPSRSTYKVNPPNLPAQPRNPNIATNSLLAPGISGMYSLQMNRVSSQEPFPAVSGCKKQRGNDFVVKSTSNSTFMLQNHGGTEPYRCTKSTYLTGSTTNRQWLGNETRTVSAARLNASENSGQFTFKKPSGCVSSSVTSSTTNTKVILGIQPEKDEKCSVAEIEQKKQQAIARRRQRMQAAQNLSAPPLSNLQAHEIQLKHSKVFQN
ncbi:ewing's tumor-associated antigen 1 isoform X2 [Hypomesus transpacificus]|uniref:ewing's tumor-associated antigen 1 isoform X2 n=1 Tax=Hypomesus transpacificus TaxID=137520 RepID=UPI001F07976B|nr:ewing's tumor-associated antigen 1 isoform X2 [Hypomesus transpacificus]